MLNRPSASLTLPRTSVLTRSAASLQIATANLIMAVETEKRNIVIVGWLDVRHLGSNLLMLFSIGGGIIGCCSAYFLTRHPNYDPLKHTITLLEASSIASNASGKAGGLLALWGLYNQFHPWVYTD